MIYFQIIKKLLFFLKFDENKSLKTWSIHTFLLPLQYLSLDLFPQEKKENKTNKNNRYFFLQ